MNPLEARRRLLGRNVYKRTTEGNPAIAQGSLARMYPGITMQGWTEQAQYEGKNLFSIDDFDSNNKATIQNGTILFNQSLGTVAYNLNLGPGAYSISIARDGYSGINIKINEVAVIDNGGGNNYTSNFDVSDGDSVVLEFSEGQNPNGEDRIIYDIMLNSGSTALSYEPYTGGQPSPSPDYPQPITSAGKYSEDTQKYEYQVKLTGKNMLPRYDSPSDWMPGSYFYIPIHGFIVGETYTASQQNPQEAGENFYVSIGTFAGNANVGVQHWLYHKSGDNLTKKSVSFKATQEVYYLNVSDISGNGVTIDSAKLDKFLELFPDLMLEIGSEPTEYTPYQEQTVTLTSDRPLTKWDKLEKRNGQWGWVYKSAEVVLDGSENWGVYAAYEGFSVGPIFDTPRLRSEGFSERFVCETGITNLGKYTLLWLGVNNHNIYFVRVPQYNAELSDSGLQDWKDYLAENPLTILTYAAEETFVPLSESEQSALNALTTYYPTTVLDNDQGCEMSVQYIADTKAYIDKKISAIQAAIVNTI